MDGLERMDSLKGLVLGPVQPGLLSLPADVQPLNLVQRKVTMNVKQVKELQRDDAVLIVHLPKDNVTQQHPFLGH